MMRHRRLRLAISLTPILLAVGCASSSQRTAWELQNRLQARLTPGTANGRVGFEQLPDGVRVTVSEQSLFPYDSAKLDDRGRNLLTNLVESLLDPRLLQIDVSEATATPLSLQQARISAVTQFIQAIQVAPQLVFVNLQQGGMPAQSATTPEVLAITVTVGARPKG